MSQRFPVNVSLKLVPSQEIGKGLMRITLFIICFCALLTGCRVNPRAEREIALLRAEILDLEDQYYSLKSRCEGEVVQQNSDDVYYESVIVGETYSPGSVIYEEAPGNFYDSNNSNLSPESVIDSPLQIEQPNFDTDDALEQIVPQSGDSSSRANRLPKKVSHRNESPGRSLASRIRAISKIVINRLHSKGRNIDGVTGHEGLELLIQPIDAEGNVEKIAGQLTVRITEQDSPAVESQIGLWQFTPEETSSFFVRDEIDQQGILLHLPWDGLVPTGERINVFVSYKVDGQNMISTSKRIKIDPPADSYSPDDPLVAGWIERDERWQDVEFEPFDEIEFESRGTGETVQDSPTFRTKTPTIERRISAPGWRPVR